MPTIEYEASPTGAHFHKNNNFARFVMGPFGSGKTTIGLMEILLRGMSQAPDPEGRRRTAALIVRNSYPELRSTTIPSYLSWFREISNITYSSPITAYTELPLPDGTVMEQKVYFIGLDDESSANKLMSLEITFAMIDEFVFVPERILDVISGRVGRFPELRYGGPTWYGYWGTSNPPPVDHWYYHLSEEKKPEGFSFYRQPAGLLIVDPRKPLSSENVVTNPNAENLQYLPDGYYERQAIGKDEDYINVYLMGNYGELRSGKPVYPMYRDSIHCAREIILPHKAVDIIVGVDVGLHGAAAVFSQLLPVGQFITFDELYREGLSNREFARDVLKPHLFNKYFKHNFQIIMDPAARIRSQNTKRSALDVFIDEGLPARVAHTNEFTARKEAVVFFLTKNDGYLLSPNVHMIRRGFLSGYRYEEVRNATGRLKDKPEKNASSHPHDALQYAALHVNRLRNRSKARARTPVKYTPASAVAGY